MTDYSILKTIYSAQFITNEAMREFIKDFIVQSGCDKFTWDISDANKFKCRVKDASFFSSRILDMIGKIEIRVSENNRKINIMIMADAKLNWSILVDLLFIIAIWFIDGNKFVAIGILLYCGWQWQSQKNMMISILDSLSQQLEFKFSSIDVNPFEDTKSKYCTKCAYKLSKEALFCEHCGEKQ